MTEHQKKLIIIIVSWNTKAITRNCLQSVYNVLDGIDNEIWVVDNSSSDGSAEMIKKEFPQVILLENAKNVGFAKANNQALRQASGDYYLLLNSDTIVPEKSITDLLQFLEKNAHVAAVSPKLINTDGRVQYIPPRLPSVRGELLDCLAYLFPPFDKVFRKIIAKKGREWWAENKPRQAEILSMACSVIRREVINEIGLLGEDYFLFSEENDYFTRMRQGGFKSYILPNVSVTHLIGKSRETNQDTDYDEIYYKSRMMYFEKFRKNRLKLIKFIYLFFFGWSYIIFGLAKIIKKQSENLNQTHFKKIFQAIWRNN